MAQASDNVPITEQANSLTTDLDLASALGCVRLFRQSDAQLFAGFQTYPSLYDLIPQLCALLPVVRRFFRAHGCTQHNRTSCSCEPVAAVTPASARASGSSDSCLRHRVVISGSGTSGRLAYFVCRTFNQLLLENKVTSSSDASSASSARGSSPLFHHLIAGGDSALMRAAEQAEDNPVRGAADLEAAELDADRILFIGVTCGLSAPYVAGQLRRVCDAPPGKYIGAVLLGFNQESQARRSIIEGWDRTFAEELAATREALAAFPPIPSTSRPFFWLCNPAIGPEALSGSTRMKGGSATKMILDALFSVALQTSSNTDEIDDASHSTTTSHADQLLVEKAFFGYERAMRAVYRTSSQLACVVERAGETLSVAEGHLYYLASDLDLAMLGLVDASECPPTFGASYTTVQCFCDGGFSYTGEPEKTSLQRFLTSILPALTVHDTVVVLVRHWPLEPSSDLASCVLALSVANHSHFVFHVARAAQTQEDESTAISSSAGRMSTTTNTSVLRVQVQVSTSSSARWATRLSSYETLAVKWALNAITTGGHVLAGKVLQNRMIDLRVSNNKLYCRSLAIVAQLGKVCPQRAERLLLRAIYNLDEDQLTESICSAQVSVHLTHAAFQSSVVACALLLALDHTHRYRDSVKLCKEALAQTPTIRKLLI